MWASYQNIVIDSMPQAQREKSAMQLDPSGYKAAAGASNQINGDAGVTAGAVLGYEIIMTWVLDLFIIYSWRLANASPARRSCSVSKLLATVLPLKHTTETKLWLACFNSCRFGLVFTVFAASDPSRQAATAPLPVSPLSINVQYFSRLLTSLGTNFCMQFCVWLASSVILAWHCIMDMRCVDNVLWQQRYRLWCLAQVSCKLVWSLAEFSVFSVVNNSVILAHVMRDLVDLNEPQVIFKWRQVASRCEPRGPHPCYHKFVLLSVTKGACCWMCKDSWKIAWLMNLSGDKC